MDDGDRAKDWAEQQASDAMEVWRRRQPQGPGRKECIDCGEEIPAARREKVPGCTRCIGCQRRLEWIRGRV